MTQDKVIDAEFEELKKNYQKFTIHFPKARGAINNIFYDLVNEKRTKKHFVKMARNTRPFISEDIWILLNEYMNFMRNLPGDEGRNYRNVYDNLTPATLIHRLLFKRPVVFYKKNDEFMLRWNGKKVPQGSNKHNDIAKLLCKFDDDSPYLRDYISYDENLLSSLIGMSTPTYYVSDGSLKSKSERSSKAHIEEGILCGLVGARNAKIDFMENRFIYPKSTKSSDDVHKSDDFWIKHVYQEAFPESKIPTESDIKKNAKIYQKIYVNGINVVYLEKRLMLSIIPYIREAMSRGVEMTREVFVAVPGIGSGVWRGKVPSDLILKLIVEGVLNFIDRSFEIQQFFPLKALALPVVDLSIYTSFTPKDKIKEIRINEDKTITVLIKNLTNQKITIFNEFRYVAQLLPKGFENCLSIAGYAWDGNSYPGNEYWCGKLASFDSQAIYCSLLGQFQNPEVNTKLADEERIKIY